MSNEIQPIDDDIQNMLRGHHAIAALRDELEIRGFRVPEDYPFRVMDKSAVSAANSAVFALLGGVPAYLLWAAENPDKFYSTYMKLAEQSAPTVAIATNSINVISDIGKSGMDDIEINADGTVKRD